MSSKSVKALLALIQGDELEQMRFDWELWHRPKQMPPPGDWTTWLLAGGRGSGKTMAGAQWVRALAAEGEGPIALVGETITEALAVMVRGPSGILTISPPNERPVLKGNMLFWRSGAEAMVLGASDPERFRGPQFSAAWCDELGCAAVDKGANQPNVFADPKSAEGGKPWFSSGAPDALMQRQVLRAHLKHWGSDANPVSEVYGAPMVDTGRISLWTWDARPYPAFPALTDTWSDATNHATGHWLTGRLGGLASDELIAAVAADFGVEVAAADALLPFVHGLAVEAVGSARDALSPLLGATGLGVRDGVEGLEFAAATARGAVAIAADDLVATDAALRSRRRPDPSEAVGRLALGYVDRLNDYLSASVTAMRPEGGAVAGENTALVLDAAGARAAAEHQLIAASAQRDTLELTLPPSFAALEVGDVIDVAGEADGPFEIAEIRDGLARKISARALPPAIRAVVLGRWAAARLGAAWCRERCRWWCWRICRLIRQRPGSRGWWWRPGRRPGRGMSICN